MRFPTVLNYHCRKANIGYFWFTFPIHEVINKGVVS